MLPFTSFYVKVKGVYPMRFVDKENNENKMEKLYHITWFLLKKMCFHFFYYMFFKVKKRLNSGKILS